MLREPEFSKIVIFENVVPELVVTSGAYAFVLRPEMDLTLGITVCWHASERFRHSSIVFGAICLNHVKKCLGNAAMH